jgi:hypothetical protein
VKSNIVLYISLTIYLGKFLYNNFEQALNIKREYPEKLRVLMEAIGATSVDVFAQWKAAEKEYIQHVHEEPIEDVLKMDYLDLLLKLKDAEYVKSHHHILTILMLPLAQIPIQNSFEQLYFVLFPDI